MERSDVPETIAGSRLTRLCHLMDDGHVLVEFSHAGRERDPARDRRRPRRHRLVLGNVDMHVDMDAALFRSPQRLIRTDGSPDGAQHHPPSTSSLEHARQRAYSTTPSVISIVVTIAAKTSWVIF